MYIIYMYIIIQFNFFILIIIIIIMYRDFGMTLLQRIIIICRLFMNHFLCSNYAHKVTVRNAHVVLYSYDLTDDCMHLSFMYLFVYMFAYIYIGQLMIYAFVYILFIYICLYKPTCFFHYCLCLSI
jgi:hypothetical protein